MLCRRALAGLIAVSLVPQLALLRPAWAVYDEVFGNTTLDIPEEREALLALYNSAGGPGWVVTEKQGGTAWNTNTSYCR